MNAFVHVPQHLKTNRILPGHGRTPRRYAPLPGVNPSERASLRRGWTETQARRRRAYGRGGSIGLVGAMLALAITALVAMGPNANVLDRSTDEPAVQLVEAVPAAPAATPRPS